MHAALFNRRRYVPLPQPQARTGGDREGDGAIEGEIRGTFFPMTFFFIFVSPEFTYINRVIYSYILSHVIPYKHDSHNHVCREWDPKLSAQEGEYLLLMRVLSMIVNLLFMMIESFRLDATLVEALAMRHIYHVP
jgi:hypothetical protein